MPNANGDMATAAGADRLAVGAEAGADHGVMAVDGDVHGEDGADMDTVVTAAMVAIGAEGKDYRRQPFRHNFRFIPLLIMQFVISHFNLILFFMLKLEKK